MLLQSLEANLNSQNRLSNLKNIFEILRMTDTSPDAYKEITLQQAERDDTEFYQILCSHLFFAFNQDVKLQDIISIFFDIMAEQAKTIYPVGSENTCGEDLFFVLLRHFA